MISYVAWRLGQSIIVLLGVTVVVFALIHLVPGDPVRVGLGIRFDPVVYAELRHRTGLDLPLPVQYFNYLGRAVTGDLGVSFFTGEPVAQILLERLPATVSLALAGFAIGLVIAFPLGALSALRHDSWLDSSIRVISQVGISVPDFWIGILLILVLAGVADLLPPSGFVAITDDPIEWVRHVAMPALAIGLGAASVLTRFVRAAVLEELSQDYVRTARAKGLSSAVIFRRHVLRNALVSITTVLGLEFAYLMGGVIVVEVLFAWPGLGLLTYQAVEQRDYPVMQGAVLLLAVIFVAVNFAVDTLYHVIDPRISAT